MGRAATWVLVAAFAVVATLAALDAVRSAAQPDPPAASGGSAGEPSRRATPLDGELVVRGVGCEVYAIELATLHRTEAPELRSCRFAVSAEGRVSLAGGQWQPESNIVALCRRNVVEVYVMGPFPTTVRGCGPAWKPDGTLTLLRDGGVVRFIPPQRTAVVLSQRELAHALRGEPVSGSLSSVSLREIAWLSNERLVAIVRGRWDADEPEQELVVFLRVQHGGRSPVRVLRSLLRLSSSPAPIRYSGLRVSPRRSFVAVRRRDLGGLLLFARDATALALPAGAPHAIAWSPDERWTALAVAGGVAVFQTEALRASSQAPPVARIALPANDLAWP